MSPIRVIARQLADLEPYRSDVSARAELLAAADTHDQWVNQIEKDLRDTMAVCVELRRQVHALTAESN